MFFQIAKFEFRYLAKQPLFKGSIVILFLLTFVSVAVPSFSNGSGGNIYKNSASAIAQLTLNYGLIFMFAAAAFVAGTVVRDDDSGFAGILRTTRIKKFDYLFGRFAGSFFAIMLVFLGVPLGIFFGSLSPSLDPGVTGPFRLAHYVYAYAFLAFPTIFFTSAFLFAIATAKRSMTWSYVALIGLLVVSTVLPLMIGDVASRNAISLMDPFGLQLYDSITRYWSTDELNNVMPAVYGVVLWNRLLFIGLGVLMLVLAYYLFTMETKSVQLKKTNARAPNAHVKVPASDALPFPRSGRTTAWAQLVVSTKFELAQLFKSPAFFVILLLGLASASIGLFFVEEDYAGQYYRLTRKVIQILFQVFTLFPIIVAIYYSGELVWRERDRRMNLIVDATVAPNWVFVLPKILAITLALFSILIASVVMGIIVQIIYGVNDLELLKYLNWYIIPVGIDMALIAVLAVLCQVVSPNKYVGWGLMVLYLLAMLFLPQAGFGDYLYLYGKTPAVLYSDMSGTAQAGKAANWFRVYWSAFAVLLVIITIGIWRRGVEARLTTRSKLLPQMVTVPMKMVGVCAIAAFIGVGAFIYTNTHVWNDYRAANEEKAYLAAYEKALLKYETLPMPKVKSVKIVANIYPEQAKVITKATYTLKNEKSVPINQIHLKWSRDTKVVSAAIDGAVLDHRYARFNYQIFKLAKPLMPGAAVNLHFESDLHQRGFKNEGNTTRLLSNGTFVSNFDFAPVIGVKRLDLLSGRADRRAQGLPEELKVPALDDPKARMENYTSFDMANSDISLSTSADQTPIAPGAVASDTVADGRRTIRYVSKAPIQNFFSLQSGRYAVKTKMHRGFPLEVYYHPQHAFNIDRMLNGMDASLSYFQDNFGPYQFDYARIIEFPAYEFFAQAYAGTMPYSEALGFLANLEDPSQNDIITFVTAHELAHQYWAGQLISANAEGAEVLTETLAQYSASVVMNKMYGPERTMRFHAFNLNGYLSGRSNETIEEVPLNRSFGRSYIHYEKGEMVMNLIRAQIGEAQVNRALRNLLKEFPASRGAPYPTTRDLVRYLRAEAPANQQALITDLFEKITLYDLRVERAQVTPRADGRYDVSMTVSASKYYADGQSKESEAPLREQFMIGAFLETPQNRAFNRKDVIAYETRTITSGKQVVRFTVDKLPKYVAVDPLVQFIDKRPNDNVFAIK